MESELRVCGIETESIVDGKGIRFVVFVQGCPHHCPGCHNPQSHPFEGGTVWSIHDLFEKIRENPLLKGVTFSGGEPFCQPGPLTELARLVHSAGLDVTTYTGYLYENLVAMQRPEIDALLEQTDLLVDGPFLREEKDLTLRFRGSRNQRVINMAETRRRRIIVLEKLEEDD
ncbi:anaerobic ribonucleoside-triphosphate reductase activating protein [Clostridium sp. W14A]|uniref:Anaerobic ribonucleoside-triphosphate reductase-activating protein n=1 Tax=Caproicibacter fermentans TaxID=2576756 RepID=A0A7G8T7V4_9FIRM|nr:anaerobic ribonucleoside-triphosphate reductase activating protein [Caproicibacter fermentans]OCN01090.1 anaerobic ribonucleoside-triphosphate reductase activating protein [Clostridium sp. W14A]QNK39695.1 anaerobic ribonucleoside-triphosphate reductase activating protein [Caproicibacter fermentans]